MMQPLLKDSPVEAPSFPTQAELRADSPSARSVLNSILAGYAAGISGTLVGHPFDSAKVWLQTQQNQQQQKHLSTTTTTSPAARGAQLFQQQQTQRAVHTASTAVIMTPRSLVSQIRALYAGVTGPLMTVGLVQSVNFAVYDAMRRFLYSLEDHHHHDNNNNTSNHYLHHDSLSNVAVASTTAGTVLALFTSPLLITKVQQQTVVGLSFRQALRRTWQTGLFVGLGPHLITETVGRAAYFCTYEAIKRQFLDDNSIALHHRMASAAAAGSLCWSVIFPLDAVRNRLYAQTTRTQMGAVAMAQHMYYGGGGWRAFYRGFGVTLVRAGPVAAAVLPVYDWALEELSSSSSW